MDFIKPLYETSLYSHYISPAWELVKEEFEELAPIERGHWHFRSITVLVGIVCNFSVFLISLFQSSALLTIFSLAATAILCFALYYVSRFEEQKRLIELLSDLEGQIQTLHGENATLKTTSQELKETRDSLVDEVSHLKETQEQLKTFLTRTESINSQLDESLQLSQTQFESYKKANESAHVQIETNLRILAELEKTIKERQSEISEITIKLSAHEQRQADLTREIDRLEEVRRRNEETANRLEGQVNRLENQIDLNTQNSA